MVYPEASKTAMEDFTEGIINLKRSSSEVSLRILNSTILSDHIVH